MILDFFTLWHLTDGRELQLGFCAFRVMDLGRQRGSHIIVESPNIRFVAVLRPRLSLALLLQKIEEAGMTRKEFLRLL